MPTATAGLTVNELPNAAFGAEITGLEAREISGAKLEFYVLSVLENNMKVMVPKHNAKSVGLRMLVDEAEVERVYSVLAHRGAKISPLRNLAPHWESWERGKKFPMGLPLGMTLATYLVLGAIYGA